VGTSSAPVFPFPGGTAGVEAPDPEQGKPGHFAWSRWIKQFVKNLDAQTVKRSGDTMTGPLTLAGPQGSNNTAATIANIEAYQRPFPIGAVIQYAGTTAPTDWHLCDGSEHGSAALAAILAGTPNPNATPDLRGRFIVGAGGAYARGATGGAELVTLSVNQSGLRHHNHWVDPPAASTNEAGSWHQHSGGTGGMNQNATHRHDALTREGITTGDSEYWIDTADASSGGEIRWQTVQVQPTNTDHAHAFTTDAANPIHQHTVDIGGFNTSHEGNWNATEAHENRPPYYALVYIIKKA
jgi:microcystin-dependent protein